MTGVPEAVVPSRFPVWVRSRDFAILFLGEGVSVPRPRSVWEGLESGLTRSMASGWMSRGQIPDEDWYEQHFRTELGPFRRGQPAPAGVYLFHEGKVAAHHGATAVAGTEATWAAVRDYLRERIEIKQTAQDSEEGWTYRGQREPEAPRPARPALPRDEGPYALLEVSRDADDDAVKKAYRKALLLNHPDKCANLSSAIQQFARERTQLILAAWDEIKAERGIR